MGKSKIDPIIQDKLYGHKTPIDADALWSAIEPELDESKPKRRYWLLLILLCILLAGGMYCLLSENGDTVLTSDISRNTTTHVVASAGKTDVALTNAIQTEEIAQPIFLDEIVEQKTAHSAKAKTTIPTELNRKQVKSNNHSTVNSTINTNYIQQKPTQSTPAKQDVSKDLTQQAITQPTTNTILTANIIDKQTLSLFDIDDPELSLSKEDIVMPNDIATKYGSYTYPHKGNPLSILAYYGPGFSHRMLYAEGNNLEHLAARNTTESLLENHRLGLLLKYRLPSGLYVQTGIEATRINEKFYYKTERIDTTWGEGVVRIEVDDIGNEIPVIGEVQIYTQYTKRYIFYNSFNALSIPLSVGYERRFGLLLYKAEAGVLFNKRLRFDGTQFDESNKPSDSVNYFNTNMGVTLQGSVGIGYALPSNATVWLSPSAMYTLKSVTADSYAYDQRYLLANILFGIEYRF